MLKLDSAEFNHPTPRVCVSLFLPVKYDWKSHFYHLGYPLWEIEPMSDGQPVKWHDKVNS